MKATTAVTLSFAALMLAWGMLTLTLVIAGRHSAIDVTRYFDISIVFMILTGISLLAVVLVEENIWHPV